MSLSRVSAAVLLAAGLASAQYLPQAAFNNTYNDSRGYPRGFVGQAPVDFTITGVEVYNEGNHTMQTVSIMALSAKPPAYSGSHTVTASELLFFAKDQKSNTKISTGAVKVKKGQWFGVLGVCHEAAQTVSSSYSVTGGYTTNVLGQPMKIERLIMQAILRTNNGLGPVAVEGAGTGNMGRVKIYVAGQGPIPTAVDFGDGTTNKPIGAQPYMSIPKFSSTYNDSRGYPRGFYFQAPKTFIVTGFEVFNEGNHTMQTVACYVLKAKPPTYPSEVVPTSSELVFFAKDQKSNTLLKPKAPIPVSKGAWFGVLGVCHEAAQTVSSSYSASGATEASILGTKVAVNRLLSQHVIRTNNGLGGIADNSGYNIGRVQVHIAGQSGFGTIFPEMTTVGLPSVNSTPKLDVTPGIPTPQVGVLLLSTGRMATPVPTPFGDLLVTLPIGAIIPVPGGKGQVPIALPNDTKLFNAIVDWQTFVFDLTNSTFGATNGTEWKIGQ